MAKATERKDRVKVVWQSPRGPNEKTVLVTLNWDKRVIEGTTFPPVYREIRPNKVGQYVLQPTEMFYDDQLAAMGIYEDLYQLIRLGSDGVEGQLPKSFPMPELENVAVDPSVVATLRMKLEQMQREKEELGARLRALQEENQ